MGFKVRHINCATMRPRGGRLLLGAPPEGQSPTLVCHCLLIETDSGLVLIDSGFGLADLADPARRIGRAFAAMGRPSLDPAETARHQIEALGYQARDVRHIILTHLDLDHAGGLSDFPDARVHLYRKEYEAGTKPKGRERFRYRPAQWAHGPDWALYDVLGEAWHGFECVRQLQGLPPEILIVPLTGHTRGHAGVAVATDEGWLLHCGDAYFHHGEIAAEAHCPLGLSMFQAIVQVNGQERRVNQQRLQALAQDEASNVRLFSAHCAHDYQRLSEP